MNPLMNPVGSNAEERLNCINAVVITQKTVMWKEGSIKVNGEVFHYWMKQYDKGSEWGIDGGRISKLMLKRDGKIVCNYDRGWDIEPADENTQLALELLLHSENW